ncbi:thiol:disulfide interchange protein DsbD [Vibrio sp. MACH09]|uniref:protein-disulfide reductase DsbD n=1 Tax=Vibrio sp. MACH09 TaxID=3025122 RepID=UPI00279076AB|nr:protein-disulfide reductase DsbD [Vibrio sp. MACH09]GLO62178.1 thiol:disulfide interchange protein DsbD [Vibrio sp. MACH09]
MRAFLSIVFISLLSISFSSFALFGKNDQQSAVSSFDNGNSRFVTVNEAFPFSSNQVNSTVYLNWDVKPEYYLYQHQFSVSIENGTIGSLVQPQGKPYKDQFFGSVQIYTEPLTIQVPVTSINDKARLIVKYQGCAKAGFCYPPETRLIEVNPLSANDASVASSAEQTSATSNNTVQQNTLSDNQESLLAGQLADNWWTPLLFLALGIGLAFTPCVFPMYPILTGIVLGNGKLSQSRALSLSFVYVQGMALTYTLLGLVVASAGLQFQAALQHPYVLIGLSIMFILLALSMFGAYTLQLPSAIQTWLNNQSNKQQGGNIGGVFLMGAISGLVCSPCTTAPLSGALLYVAQSGDLLTGGVALYALGLGMGIPLITVAVFGNKLLPKAGAWMDRVKILFGFILLAAPIYLLERIIPAQWAVTLWGLLGIFAFGWLYHLKNSLEFAGWKQSLLGIVAMLGILASALPVYNQWSGNHSSDAYQPTISFTRIASVEELEQQLVLANKANKPVMLDFYADWCVACKEFEKYTFHTPEVEEKLKGYILLQADVTKNSPADIALFKRLKVMGLPTIDFWDADGNYQSRSRLTGFMEAEPFIEHLNKQN